MPRSPHDVLLPSPGRFALFGDDVLLTGADGRFERRRAAVIIDQGRIEAIRVNPAPGDLPPRTREVTGLLAPGYIDLQNNGCYGADVATDEGALELIARRVPEQGVTSLLPTVVSSPEETYRRVFARLEGARRAGGADLPGLHLEGPFFSPGRVGAHHPKHLKAVDLELLARLLNLAAGKVPIFTLAPELAGALEAIRLCLARAVIPSAGHTDANREQLQRALDAGLPLVTHVTNAMDKDLTTGPAAAPSSSTPPPGREQSSMAST